MGVRTGDPMSVHTIHCTHIQSYLTLRKREVSCGWWWLMTVHQHTREGNSLKPTKMCSLKNRLCLLKYAGRPTPKNVIMWSRKTAQDIISPTNKGEHWKKEIIGKNIFQGRFNLFSVRRFSHFYSEVILWTSRLAL